MHNYLRTMYSSLDAEDRWDMVQDVWVSYLSKSEDVSFPRAYCNTALRNLHIDIWRKRGRYPEVAYTEWNRDIQHDNDHSDKIIDTLEYYPAVQNLLAILSERETEFLSYFWDGISFDRDGQVAKGHIPWCAEQMGVSYGAAKQLLVRIRRKAARVLEDLPYEI